MAVFGIYISAVFLVSCAAELTNVSVVTQVGEFVGFKENVTVDGTVVSLSKFFGIPYAEPPIGDLRFRKPVQKAALNAPLIVQDHGSECIQILSMISAFSHSEDCLFLNIYAPEKQQGGDNLAVMIFIHGGSFISGSANVYNSDRLAAVGNVIVVTINYRLSVLGFLNIVKDGPGNFGLWDQHLAIRWVHDNIEAFGGDEGRITIFGESAGAASVIYQGMYPGNQGLFQRIIAQSGSASSSWALSLYPQSEASEFVGLVGCKKRTFGATMECLRNLTQDVINQTLNDFSNGLYRDPLPFIPSVDKEFLTVSPSIVLNKDKSGASESRSVFATFDLMMGLNSGEGGLTLVPEAGVEGDPAYFLPNRSYFENHIVPICARTFYGPDASNAVFEALLNVYVPWDDPENPDAIRNKFVDMYTDGDYLAPTAQTMDLYAHVSNKDPYLYYFTAVPHTHSIFSQPWLGRPNHGDELPYVFGSADMFGAFGLFFEFEEWEKDLVTTMIRMWSNFAKTGNPNTPRDIGVEWLSYSPSRYYMDIGKFLNQTATKERLHERRAHLWNHVLPSINQAVFESCDPTTSGVTRNMMCCYSLISALVFFILTNLAI